MTGVNRIEQDRIRTVEGSPIAGLLDGLTKADVMSAIAAAVARN
jgi:predicted regulator of Ras-like GTPase activity (Roadblock/LC7/MglB family)